MPSLFYEPYIKTYYSPAFSLSSCVCLIMFIFAIILPFFAAFATDNFWTSISEFYEQPLVTFNSEFMLYVLDNGDTKFYSSVLKLNDYYDNIISSPLIQSESLDLNNDGLVDKVKLKISFNSNPQTIQNMKLMIFFNYALQSKVKMMMQSMVLIDEDCPYGVSSLNVIGDITLKQRSPISSGTIASTLYYNNIFSNSTQPFDFITLFRTFNDRNLTTPFDYKKVTMPYMGSSFTEIEVQLNVPSYQKITYLTPILLQLKNAWIQYLAIFVPVFVVIYSVMRFVFKYQIFETAVSNDIPVMYKAKVY